MIPKLKNCLEAVQEDVKKVHILDGRLEHSLLIEIFTTSGVGTEIKKGFRAFIFNVTILI